MTSTSNVAPGGLSKVGLCTAFLAIALAAAWMVTARSWGKSTSRKWHQGPEWERLFRVYDEMANDRYGNCESKLVPSGILVQGHDDKPGPRYTTQVHICGESSTESPVMMLHGASTNGLMYGDWLMPTLSKNRKSVAVDFPCDVGRSFPLEGDTNYCPQNASDVADWAIDLIEQLDMRKERVSLVGYSYGSFVSSQVALKFPDAVDKLVLFAPAAVFAPLKGEFLFRAITFGILYSLIPASWPKLLDGVRDWFFGWMMASGETLDWDSKEKDLRIACDEAGPAVLPTAPIVLNETELRAMNEANPTLLVIGEEEVVIDAQTSIEAAVAAGIQVKAYPKSGHMLVAEQPREDAISVVSSFLNQ
eukprot:CAMPEP_0197442144 /NCGR_PEP_ID=MMETSP1175-20131217/8231_1 /TAXON_ID=1003142 /ORGANISM="Triceratium dubium, Strain CCMP147" /LENGTH=361 /DNA_ID=CAMNT_0042972557 /DNA_START=53 /DNA_END=1138 /DNA_ORIENTATION=+